MTTRQRRQTPDPAPPAADPKPEAGEAGLPVAAPAAPPRTPPDDPIRDREHAAEVLAQVGALKAEIAGVVAQYKARRAALDADEDEALAAVEVRLETHLWRLEHWLITNQDQLLPAGRKTLKLRTGRIGLRTAAETMEIVNEDALVTAIKDRPELALIFQHKVTVDRALLVRRIDAPGLGIRTLPGIRIVPGGEAFQAFPVGLSPDSTE